MILEENILPLIPQRPPFVMISSLLQSDEKLTRTSFLITGDNVFLDNGAFMEGGLLENIAQTAAAGAGYKAMQNNKPVSPGYIGAVKNFEVFLLPKTNDELTTEITVQNQVFNVAIVSGKIWRGEILVAQCEMKIFIGDPA